MTSASSSAAHISVVRNVDEFDFAAAKLFPKLDELALHGLAGEVVESGRYINVEKAGLLFSFLTYAAASFGDVGIRLSGKYYPGRLFSVLVGNNSACEAAADFVSQLFQGSDEKTRERSAFTVDLLPLEFGADLIRATSTNDDDNDSTSGGLRAVSPRVVPSVLLSVCDFERTLRAAKHTRNPLGVMLSSAWESADLKLLARNREAICDRSAHVCLVGQIEMDELRRVTADKSNLRGLLSRTLWVAVHQSAPSDEVFDETLIEQLAVRVASAVAFAKRTSYLTLSAETETVWAEMKEQFSAQTPGIAGIVASERTSNIRRLAVIYSLLDKSRIIRPCHLEAAFAVWRYCEASVKLIFAENRVGTVAVRILDALLNGPKTRTELMTETFCRNLSAEQLDIALTELQSLGLVSFTRGGGGRGNGRSMTTWSLTSSGETVAETSWRGQS